MTPANLAAVVAIALLAGGCIFIEKTTTAPPRPAPPTAGPSLWADPEIEAAAQLGFDSSRTAALKQIARKPMLCPQSQALLVQKAYLSLDFESSKTEVLTALIDNPDFSNAGKAAIVNGLGSLDFESSKSQLLAQINSRGALRW